MLKERLPVIGAAFLFMITIVNFTRKDETVTGIVSISLLVLTFILYVLSKKGSKTLK